MRSRGPAISASPNSPLIVFLLCPLRRFLAGADLQDFCQFYTPTAEISLTARLNQLLGLPPEPAGRTANRQVVELWVDPQFLFRPSPDPEITDHEAELSFRPLNEFISVPLSYQHWFYAQYDQRYQDNGQPIDRNRVETSSTMPYPWTQLGYIYDWGNPRMRLSSSGAYLNTHRLIVECSTSTPRSAIISSKFR